MLLSADQKRAINSIVCLMETGALPTPASYGAFTVLADGAGISGGIHQATDKGAFDRIISRYKSLGGSKASSFDLYASKLASDESTKFKSLKESPQWVHDLKTLWVSLGADPVMQRAQDEVFNEDYLNPALVAADSAGCKQPLSALVLYDCAIQSGPGRISKHRAAFSETSPAKGGDEAVWLKAFVRTRRAWKLAFDNVLVQKSVYREDAYDKLMVEGSWALLLPLTVRGTVIR